MQHKDNDLCLWSARPPAFMSEGEQIPLPLPAPQGFQSKEKANFDWLFWGVGGGWRGVAAILTSSHDILCKLIVQFSHWCRAGCDIHSHVGFNSMYYLLKGPQGDDLRVCKRACSTSKLKQYFTRNPVVSSIYICSINNGKVSFSFRTTKTAALMVFTYETLINVLWRTSLLEWGRRGRLNVWRQKKQTCQKYVECADWQKRGLYLKITESPWWS